MKIKCKRCGWQGNADDAVHSVSPYHDCACPICGSTNIDTSEINNAWAEKGKKYGYGNDNVLDMSPQGEEGE